MQRNRLIVLLAVLSFFLSSATAVGISPGSANVDGVLRGGYAEAQFHVSNTDDFSTIITIRTLGAQSGWITYPGGSTITVGPKQSATIVAVVKPPADAGNGLYNVYIRAEAQPAPGESGGIGAKIAVGVEARLSITVSDHESLSVNVDHVTAKDVEESSTGTLFVGMRNDGNVRVIPTFKISILDKNGKEVKTLEADGMELMPTTVQEVPVQLPTTDLVLGPYTATVQTLIRGSKIDERSAPFNIVEVGGLRKFGELTALTASPSEAAAGSLVKVTAAFKNTGSLGLDAKFVGEVYLDSALAATLTSDELAIGAGESKEFNVFFKPEKPGTYAVRGRVIYSKRTTDDKEVIVKVSSKEESFPWSYAIAAIVVLAAIAYFYTRKGAATAVVPARIPAAKPRKKR
jgi:hypothetical protein